MKKLLIAVLALSSAALADSYKIKDYRSLNRLDISKLETIPVTIATNATVRDLYKAVAERINIPLNTFFLAYGPKVIHYNKTWINDEINTRLVSSLKIPQGAVLSALPIMAPPKGYETRSQ